MRSYFYAIFLLFFALPVTAQPTGPQVVWVNDQTGDNKNNCSGTAECQTIGRGIAACQAIQAGFQGDCWVYLTSGMVYDGFSISGNSGSRTDYCVHLGTCENPLNPAIGVVSPGAQVTIGGPGTGCDTFGETIGVGNLGQLRLVNVKVLGCPGGWTTIENQNGHVTFGANVIIDGTGMPNGAMTCEGWAEYEFPQGAAVQIIPGPVAFSGEGCRFALDGAGAVILAGNYQYSFAQIWSFAEIREVLPGAIVTNGYGGPLAADVEAGGQIKMPAGSCDLPHGAIRLAGGYVWSGTVQIPQSGC